MKALKLGAVGGALLAAVGCDYTGDFLFPEAATEVPAVYDMGLIEPVVVTSLEEAAAAAIYGQVSSTGTSVPGGVTYTFEGTGRNVCVWVDPEVVTWNQAVATRGGVRRWAYPDNHKDDGDLDLEVGLAIYYNGSPGVEIGDFAIRYQDALGNPVAIELNECVIRMQIADAGGHAGRGSPEYCTIFNTQPGVTYVVKMESWATPIDDDRLGFGFLLADGNCTDLISDLGMTDPAEYECVVPGEAIDYVVANGPGPWFGADEVPTRGGAAEFEASFCGGEVMADVCAAEAAATNCRAEGAQCFCGDPTNTPTGGSF